MPEKSALPRHVQMHVLTLLVGQGSLRPGIKDVAGLAEQIMAEDEQRRQQELVIAPRFFSLLYSAHVQSGRV